MEATKGREMNRSKSGEVAAQAIPSLDLDPLVYIGKQRSKYASS